MLERAKSILTKFWSFAENHFHLIMYTLVSLICMLLTVLALKLYLKIGIHNEKIVTVELVQVIDKVEIKIHPPQRKIVILKCEHEVFLITDDDLFDHVRSGEVLYMKITEYARVIYIKDKVVNKEVNRIEYDFSQPRFKEDDGIYNEFDIFKHGNDKII